MSPLSRRHPSINTLLCYAQARYAHTYVHTTWAVTIPPIATCVIYCRLCCYVIVRLMSGLIYCSRNSHISYNLLEKSIIQTNKYISNYVIKFLILWIRRKGESSSSYKGSSTVWPTFPGFNTSSTSSVLVNDFPWLKSSFLIFFQVFYWWIFITYT